MTASWRRRLAPGALAAALLLAAPGARAAEPIEIGAIGPLTGGSAPMGTSMLNGMTLAVRELNAAGGILGRTVTLLRRDDFATNERGAHIAKELTVAHPVVAGIGLVNTGVTLAAEPYFEEARIPLIVSVATGTLITRRFAPPEYKENYVFRMSATTALESAMIVAESVRRGFARPAILADGTSYGQVGRQDLEAALASAGAKPVAVEKFNIGDSDMSAQLARLRYAGADVLLTYGIGPELAWIARQRTAMGWGVPMMGSWTLSMSNFIDGAGASAEGAVMPETFIAEPRRPRQKAFLDAYTAAYGARIPSPVSAAQGYDTIYLLAAAIAQAGSTDGPAIRAALERLDAQVEGAVKTYDHPFTPADHEAIRPEDVVLGVVKDGRVVAYHGR